MPTANLGRIGFVNKGTYVGGTTVHKVNDIRKYNNSIYVCIQAHNVEHLPTDVLYWQVWMDTANYYIKSEVDSLLLTEIGVPIASAATTNVGGVNAGDIIHITGTTTITSLGASVTGTVRTLVFDDILTMTHNATSMILPGSADMLTVAGSSAEFICENGALGYWRCTNVTHHAISMAELSYISTLTSNAQDQINLKVGKDSSTGAAYIPSGTTAQRPVAPTAGYTRFNTDLVTMEIWKGTSWALLPDSTGTVLTTTDQSISGTKSFSTGIKVEGANVTAYGKNFIINGGFDYWNYATSQTTSGYGSDDRWSNGNAGSTKTHSLVNATDTERTLFSSSKFSRTVVTSVAGAGNYVNKDQAIENVTKLAGKTVTISFWAKADTAKNISVDVYQTFGTGGSPSAEASGTGILVALTTTWQKKTITWNVPSIVGKTLGTDGVHTTATRLRFFFDAGATFATISGSLGQQSGTFDIAEVKLEEGSVATPWTPYEGEFGGEIQACQRYYREEIIIGTGFTVVPSQWNILWALQLNMRTLPSSISYHSTDGNKTVNYIERTSNGTQVSYANAVAQYRSNGLDLHYSFTSNANIVTSETYRTLIKINSEL